MGRRGKIRTRLGRFPEVTPNKLPKRTREPDENEVGSAEDETKGEIEIETKECLPLDELIDNPGDHEVSTANDQTLLPRVIASFLRHLTEACTPQNAMRQTTGDKYGRYISVLFSRTRRNFDALTDQRFIALVASCHENRVKHNDWSCALKKFRSFWHGIGGYNGVETLDEASQETLNHTVKPVLEDAPGICGAGAETGSLCRRPKQRCKTCGTSLRCSKHFGGHSVEECRGVFWAMHTPDGKRLRTMRDFFQKPDSRKTEPPKPPDIVTIEE